MSSQTERVCKALAKQGLNASFDGLVYRIRQGDCSDAPWAEVLLPKGYALEGKAAKQLATFAAVRHPHGGQVFKAIATPDFHPGTKVPVGAVVATSVDMVIPSAIGTDIQCGMRLHVSEINTDLFAKRKHELVALLKGDLLLGTRDLPMRGDSMKAIFSGGCMEWLDSLSGDPLGALQNSDVSQLEKELENIYDLGSYDGNPRWAPESMVADRSIIRDPSLGTVGGGNHFVEFQVVEEIYDRHKAYAWGIKKGQVGFMIHSGSRLAGVSIGNYWQERAKALWPEGHRYPNGGIFPIYGEEVTPYMEALHSASNYASVNRMLLAEMIRLRMREVFAGDLEAPLLFDVPHNIVLQEGNRLIHRKGATPAHKGQPVLIPGSMGQASYLMVGHGSERFLKSTSHGAGRQVSRYEMQGRARKGEDIGLQGVECITLKEERLVQEAPAAYKEIGPIIDIQAQVGLASPVARLRPLLTFKA